MSDIFNEMLTVDEWSPDEPIVIFVPDSCPQMIKVFLNCLSPQRLGELMELPPAVMEGVLQLSLKYDVTMLIECIRYGLCSMSYDRIPPYVPCILLLDRRMPPTFRWSDEILNHFEQQWLLQDEYKVHQLRPSTIVQLADRAKSAIEAQQALRRARLQSRLKLFASVHLVGVPSCGFKCRGNKAELFTLEEYVRCLKQNYDEAMERAARDESQSFHAVSARELKSLFQFLH
jgi:hypothetical protein